ncbi:hypothetical protein Goshw_019811 [Gossypium schwendimanii]|uniref:DUF4283 domain-containing protein n=1 Tax=Gossypium schwendimanii TaxID=34291 RepID=A0A7J9KMR9_GOSSC|nr:hypothetical protein [Gossypium schwendimanii]
MENDLAGLSLEDEEDGILQAQKELDSTLVEYEFCLVGCFHMDQVINGALWTFNNHLLMIHRLEAGDDPFKVPLIYTIFWVQVYDVLPGFFNQSLAKQIGDFLGRFLEYDSKNVGRGICAYLRIRVQLDVRSSLKRKKNVMFLFGKCTYVNFKYEWL